MPASIASAITEGEVLAQELVLERNRAVLAGGTVDPRLRKTQHC